MNQFKEAHDKDHNSDKCYCVYCWNLSASDSFIKKIKESGFKEWAEEFLGHKIIITEEKTNDN